MLEFHDLFEYLIHQKKIDLLKKISSLLVKYSNNQQIIKLGQAQLQNVVLIDLWELESLINPNKFDFPESDTGVVSVENNPDI